jgi:hypothetical protein
MKSHSVLELGVGSLTDGPNAVGGGRGRRVLEHKSLEYCFEQDGASFLERHPSS